MIKTIKKRDGRVTEFDINKISNAIQKHCNKKDCCKTWISATVPFEKGNTISEIRFGFSSGI